MAKVFGILTAIALVISAFVAFKNKTAYADSIDRTLVEKGKLEKSKVRLAAAEEELNITLPSEIAELDSQVEDLTAAEASQKKGNDEVTAQVEEISKKLASNKEKLDVIREKTSKMGDIPTLASKIKTTNDEIVELVTLIDAGKAKLANLTAQNAAADAQVSASKTKFEHFSNNESLPTVNTSIRSIYPTWGFVTLGAGNNAGIATNSTLNVVRGSQVIGQLLVTAVESTTASASIVPDSLADDVTLMVGDRVVPGVKSTTPAEN